MKKIRINGKSISGSSKTFIVAEIGLNHNNDLNLAKKIVQSAKKSGADAVKFQVYDTDLFINKKKAKEQFKILKQYELSYETITKIKQYCDKIEIVFFASPFDLKSARFLYDLNIPVIKIASSELSNSALIKYVSRFKKPLFISTGLHTFPEIKQIINNIEMVNQNLVVFHCVSDYPLKYEDANLNMIQFFKEQFHHYIGFSDHSRGYLLDVLAVSLGVKVIEKHFTIDQTLPGPDQKLSLNPEEFRILVQQIRLTERTLGHKKKRLTHHEKKIKRFALKGLYAAENIKKGEKFSIDNINIQRPLLNKKAQDIFSILNKKAGKAYKKGEPI